MYMYIPRCTYTHKDTLTHVHVQGLGILICTCTVTVMYTMYDVKKYTSQYIHVSLVVWYRPLKGELVLAGDWTDDPSRGQREAQHVCMSMCVVCA